MLEKGWLALIKRPCPVSDESTAPTTSAQNTTPATQPEEPLTEVTSWRAKGLRDNHLHSDSSDKVVAFRAYGLVLEIPEFSQGIVFESLEKIGYEVEKDQGKAAIRPDDPDKLGEVRQGDNMIMGYTNGQAASEESLLPGGQEHALQLSRGNAIELSQERTVRRVEIGAIIGEEPIALLPQAAEQPVIESEPEPAGSSSNAMSFILNAPFKLDKAA